MSWKFLVFVGLVGVAGYSLTRAKPPVPPHATAADSAAVANASLATRFNYGLGAVGSRMIGGVVRNMVNSTEQSLNEMKPAIKKAGGPDAARAKKFSKNIVEMDTLALRDLRMGNPIHAFKTAMEAKSLLGSVRDNVRI